MLPWVRVGYGRLAPAFLVFAVCGCGAAPAGNDGGSADGGGADDGSADGTADSSGGALSARLSQAVSGGFLANPRTYPEIPVRVEVGGAATAVEVRVGAESFAANRGEDGWTATVPIADLADGIYPVTAVATDGRGEATSAAELRVSRAGAQLTTFATLRFTGTPRLHSFDGRTWVSWTDRREPNAQAWIQEIDGAGRWLGSAMRLVGEAEETLYARVAVGDGVLGILYQQPGTPYSTYFKSVTFDGVEAVPPLALDPPGHFGKFGGDIVADGASFVMVYRTRHGSDEAVRVIRVDADGTTTGPVAIATSGADDPHGAFPPHSFVSVSLFGDGAIVGFVRDHFDAALELALPKAQFALVRNDGSVAWTQIASAPATWSFHREARAFPLSDGVVAVWTARDVLESDNSPNRIFAGVVTESGIGPRVTLLDAVGDTDEPVIVDGGEGLRTLAWLDHRLYVESPDTGGIRLHVGRVDGDLRLDDERTLEHARVVAGLSELRGLAVGTNTLLAWLDARNSPVGVFEFQPEIWLETVWR
jgi:hypothetical protein